MHVPEPVVSLYVPVTHAVHGPPFGPSYPALQVQLLGDVQLLHEAPEFAGQSVQDLSLSHSGAHDSQHVEQMPNPAHVR